MNFKTKISKTTLLTQKELENGMWQFLLDHSLVLGGGYYSVKYLKLTTKEDFLKRMYARASGFYKVKDEDKLKEEMITKTEQLENLLKWKNFNVNKENKLFILRDKCKWKYNLIVYTRKLMNKLLLKWTKDYEI